MKPVGEYLKENRIRLNKSKDDISKVTRIKKAFIGNIESGEWQKLPEYPVVAGFVKSIAKALNLKEEQVVALLRRDYPPTKIDPNPKPDIKQKFSFNPKLAFLSGIIFVVFAILAYVIFQYLNYVKAPLLEVASPKEGQRVSIGTIKVVGVTDPDSIVTINNQPVLVSEDGNFVAELEIGKETVSLDALARSRAGKETRKTVNIKVE